MDFLVEESQADLSRNTDSRQDTELRMRWQQRGLIRDSLLQHVQLQIEVNTELRKEGEKADEYAPSSTDTY